MQKVLIPQSNHVKVDFASFYQKLNILKQEDIEKQDPKNNEQNPDNNQQITEFYDELKNISPNTQHLSVRNMILEVSEK